MSTPLFSIGGISSGLDTDSIITQLMQLERLPVVRFQQRQASLRAVDNAWGQVTTRLSAVRTAVDGLRQADSFGRHVVASSSQPDAVTATASGARVTGEVSFTVERLAAAHQLASAGSFASGDALVGAGELTLTRPDGTVMTTVSTDEHTTLAQLAQRITDAKAGVRATVIKTEEGVHRLVLTATETGSASQFSLSGDLAGLGAGEELRAGQDAHLRMGTLDVYRASNTVTDLVDGVTIQLRKVTDQPVTVGVERDLDTAVASIKGFVDSLNGALTTMKELSAYDPESKRSGPLQGNSTLRNLVNDLRATVSSAVAGLDGDTRHISEVGIGLDRHGGITLDETKLRAALTDDYDRVTSLFARTGAATTGSVEYAAATSATASGSYEVHIDTAAAVALSTGASYTPPMGNPKVFTITTDTGTAVSVTIEEGDSLATAVQRINTALAAQGVATLVAEEQDGALRLAETRYGAAAGFTVTDSGDLGLDGEFTGTDVAGTIGGLPATGRGRTLTGAEGGATGLSLRITATQAEVDGAGGAFGQVSFSTGLAGMLDATLREFEGAGGLIARARESLTTEIRRFDDRIAEFDIRLASRETTLRRQFTALESAMGRLQSQSAWMSSQILSMNAQNGG